MLIWFWKIHWWEAIQINSLYTWILSFLPKQINFFSRNSSKILVVFQFLVKFVLWVAVTAAKMYTKSIILKKKCGRWINPWFYTILVVFGHFSLSRPTYRTTFWNLSWFNYILRTECYKEASEGQLLVFHWKLNFTFINNNHGTIICEFTVDHTK